MLLVLALLTGCRGQQAAFSFQPALASYALSGPAVQQGTPNDSGAAAAPEVPVERPPLPRRARRHLPGRRQAQVIRHPAFVLMLRPIKSGPPPDSLRPAKTPKKPSRVREFLRPGWHDQDTAPALSIMGFAALTIASVALGLGSSGFWQVVLLVAGGAVFLPLIMLSIWAAGTYLHFHWPVNIISCAAALAILGALAVGAFAGTSLSLASWVPLAVVGLICAAWSLLSGG